MWSRRSTEGARAVLARGAALGAALGALLVAAACSSGPPREPAPQREAQPAAAAPHAAVPGASAAEAAGQVPGGQAGSAAPPPPPPPPQAVAEFDRAVSLMRSGGTTEAQRRFEVLAIEYPQFAGAEINLGIMYRKSGQLDLSESALREAVHRNAASPEAWNELGVTLRLRGRFRDAEGAYRKAIAADASFAPAYRNLGVLLDLYLGDAPGALAAFERYKELSHEQKPVSGWIAELRHRVGKSAAPAAGGAPSGTPAEAPGPNAGSPSPKQSRAPVERAASAGGDAGA
jgi:tetratricopeptide (TPR) repeat protein